MASINSSLLNEKSHTTSAAEPTESAHTEEDLIDLGFGENQETTANQKTQPNLESSSASTTMPNSGSLRRRTPPKPAPKPKSLLKRFSVSTKSSKAPTSVQNRAILLMGATGAGKSSFVASLGYAAKIGHDLSSCTVDPQGWEHRTANGSYLTIIDTPGFDDSNRSDMELLGSIVDFINRKKLHVVAVIYIQKINERKLTGSTRSNLRMLRAMCGEHFFQNIILVTSMWSTIPREQFDEVIHRELEFNQSPKFWGELLEKGAVYFRWDETEQIEGTYTSEQIVKECETRIGAPALSILLEMDKGRSLEDTTAGKILTEALRKQQEKERENLLEEQEELRGLQDRRAELEAMADNLQREQRARSRVSRRESPVAIQAAQTAYRRREPVRYSPDQSPERDLVGSPSSRIDHRDYHDEDLPPPAYSRSDRIESPAPRLERRFTAGSEIYDAITERRNSVQIYEGRERSDGERERRPRSRKQSKWRVKDFLRDDYEIVVRRKRR